MKLRRVTHILLVTVCCVFMAGCLHTGETKQDRLITPLPKLTAALMALVRWPPDGVAVPSNEALVAEVFKLKPELKQAFAKTPIKIWHNDQYVIVLVCSPDGKTAWMEDASWTPYVDCVWDRSEPPHAADFTLIRSLPAK